MNSFGWIRITGSNQLIFLFSNKKKGCKHLDIILFLFFRLVELQQLPWSNHDVLKVLQSGRVRCSMEWVAMETVPRLSYLLQRALVRIGREAQRLSKPLAMCGKHEVGR